MEIRLFTLCDGAYNYNGKLTVVGTIDNIKVQRFPCSISIGVALKLVFAPNEVGDKHIVLDFINSDNISILPPFDFQGDVKIQDGEGKIAIAGNINGVPIEREGIYKQFAALEKDEIKWDYNSSTKTTVISGEGPMRDYLENAPDWDKYNAEAEHVVIGDKVTSVGAGAFYYFTALTDVELGNTVEFIGKAAFTNCTTLRNINFPANLKYVGDSAFNNDLLHSENGFNFPDGMLYIGNEAFRSAFKENEVSIPASLSVIGDDAFSNVFVSACVVLIDIDVCKSVVPEDRVLFYFSDAGRNNDSFQRICNFNGISSYGCHAVRNFIQCITFVCRVVDESGNGLVVKHTVNGSIFRIIFIYNESGYEHI